MRLTNISSAWLCPLLALGFGAAVSSAQSVISAHSGIVHYIEGDVAVDDQALQPKFGQFPDVKNGQVLSTSEGRAEVLLTPGVFLRLSENSSVRMVSNSLADTRLEMLSGTALLEVGELLENNALSFTLQGASIAFPKKGLFRLDADTGVLRVFEGQAKVQRDKAKLTAKKGQEVALTGSTLAAAKFNVKDTDPFYRWSSRRAGYISTANITSARVASGSGRGSGFFGRSTWSWNPYFGMFTYLPSNGVYMSPFGSAFYSPGMASYLIYMPSRPRLGMPGGFGAQVPISRPGPVMSAPPMGSGGVPSGGISRGGGGMAPPARGPMMGRPGGMPRR